MGSSAGEVGSAVASSAAISSGSGDVKSTAIAGGGTAEESFVDFGSGPGVSGGGANATSLAKSNGSGSANSAASAAGGGGGSSWMALPGEGGNAIADSTAMARGSGAASSLATASGGSGGFDAFFGPGGDGGSATATANASAARGGVAIATAVATGGAGGLGGVGDAGPPPGALGAANAMSAAATAKGALAQAQSTPVGSSGEAQSIATTNLAGVSVQSAAIAPTGSTATTNAIAQGGGSGQAFVNPGETAYAFSTALPDNAYSATLIDGAHDVAAALLGPRDKVFGTAILGANYAADGGGESHAYSATSTFDFGYGGDVLLSLIDARKPASRTASAFSRWNSPLAPTASKFSIRLLKACRSPRVSSKTASLIWVPGGAPVSI
jgi:hypothetical protein